MPTTKLEQAMSNGCGSLTEDLWKIIFSYMDQLDCVTSACVCKQWQIWSKAITEDSLICQTPRSESVDMNVAMSKTTSFVSYVKQRMTTLKVLAMYDIPNNNTAISAVIYAVQFCKGLLVLDLQTTQNCQIDLNPSIDSGGISEAHAITLPQTLKIVRTNISVIVKSNAWERLPSLEYVELCRPFNSYLFFNFPPINGTVSMRNLKALTLYDMCSYDLQFSSRMLPNLKYFALGLSPSSARPMDGLEFGWPFMWVREFIKDLKALEEFYLFNLPQLDSSLNGLSRHSSLKTLRIHCHHLLQDENDYDFHSGIYEDSVELKSLSIEKITEKGWEELLEEIQSECLQHLACKSPKNLYLDLEELFDAVPSLNNLQVCCKVFWVAEPEPDFKIAVPRGGFTMHIQTAKKILDSDLAILKGMGFKMGRVTDPSGLKNYTFSIDREGQLTPLPERFPKSYLRESVISSVTQPFQPLGANRGGGAQKQKKKKNQKKPKPSQQSGFDHAKSQNMKLAEKYLDCVCEEDEALADLIWGGSTWDGMFFG